MKLFISYSRKDTAFVTRLADLLQTNGHEAWLDQSEIRGSDEWRQSIVGAIRDAEAVVLVISPRSVASTDVQREITVAAEEHRRIIPVMFERAELTGSIRYELAGVQHISFVGVPFQAAADLLLEALGAPRKRPPRPSGASALVAEATNSLKRSMRRALPRLAGLGIAAAVLAVAAGVLLNGLHLGPPTGSARPGSSGATSGTAVSPHAAVWFAGYDVSVDEARYDPARKRVEVDATFINRQRRNANPVDLMLNDGLVLEWQGRRFTPSCACNGLPPEASLPAVLTFGVDPGFDLTQASLIFGGPTQHQAIVPFGGRPATSEQPVHRKLSATTKDGAGTTFKMVALDVLPADCVSGYPERIGYIPGPKDKLAVVVWLTAQTSARYPPRTRVTRPYSRRPVRASHPRP